MMRTILLDLDEAHAWALAEFVGRVQWDAIRGSSRDESEAIMIRDAVGFLRKALAEAGFDAGKNN